MHSLKFTALAIQDHHLATLTVLPLKSSLTQSLCENQDNWLGITLYLTVSEVCDQEFMKMHGGVTL